jgi:hypothetical protein
MVVTSGGFVDLAWLYDIEDVLTNDDTTVTFAGWYYDRPCKDPFRKFQRVKNDTSLYAGWKILDFDLEDQLGPVVNHKIPYELKNTTAGASPPTTWTVKDAFKTNNNVISTQTFGDGAPDDTHTLFLAPGLYDITMTTTVNGKEEIMTRTEKVGGTLTDTVTWNDYSTVPFPYTITYTLDVEDYIKFAKKNWKREFRIPDIASFVTYDTLFIQNIAESFDDIFSTNPALTEQDKANIIASFVNRGLGGPSTWASMSDSTYYMIPGVHVSAVSVEYYKYPAESLYDKILYGGIGDCEDYAILTAAIAKACGLDAAIIVMTNPTQAEGHAIAGIKDTGFTQPEPPYPSGYSFKSVGGYYACETFRKNVKALVGLVETKFLGPGWTQRAYPVSA